MQKAPRASVYAVSVPGFARGAEIFVINVSVSAEEKTDGPRQGTNEQHDANPVEHVWEGSAPRNADIFDPVPEQGNQDDLGQEENDGPRTQGKQGGDEIQGFNTFIGGCGATWRCKTRSRK